MLTTALVSKTSIITLMSLTIIFYWVITEMTMLKELRYKGTALVFQILVWLELAHVTEGIFSIYGVWILDSTPWIRDCMYWILAFFTGTWILDSKR